MFDKEAFAARERQWSRFHEWEAAHRAKLFDVDAVWAWYQEAWQLAWDAGAIPHNPTLDMDRVNSIREIRSRLARLPWPS